MECEIDPSLSEEDVEVGSFSAPWNDSTLAIFIELMDAEVKKKNRPSTTFSKNSWHFIQDRMQKLTNYPYMQIQLRNKFNLLRIVFRCFKSLLAETGVTITPGIWKVYAKEETWNRLYAVNKNARNFKKKGCPHYDKLCNIYGDTTAKREHADLLIRLTSEIDPSLNEEVVEHVHPSSSKIDHSLNKEVVEHAPPSKRPPSEIDPSLSEHDVEESSSSAPWNDRAVTTFIDLMDQEVKKKNMGSTNFSKPSWLFIQARMKELTNYPYTDNQLRNKFNLLRTVYRSFKSLLKQTGVTATPGIWKVHAEEETWYKLYVVNKNAKNFKKKGCPHFDKLCNIYGGTSVTEELAHPSTRPPSDGENEGSCDFDFDPTTKNIKEFNDADENAYLTTCKRKRPSSPKRRVMKESIGGDLTKIVSAFVESSIKRSDLLNQKLLASCEASGETKTNPTPTDGHALLMESIGALDTLEDVDDSQYLKALKLLREDPIWREIFLKIPLNRRRGVVLNL